MELIAEPEGIPTIRAFPTSTPILDVLRPLNQQEAERLITGHYRLDGGQADKSVNLRDIERKSFFVSRWVPWSV